MRKWIAISLLFSMEILLAQDYTASKSDTTVSKNSVLVGISTVQDEGVDLAQRPKINCVGAGVACTDDLANNRTLVTVSGGGGGSITGGTCTNQVTTAIDTSGVPTCSDVSSAMIPANTIVTTDITDANVTLAKIANAAANRVVVGSGPSGSGAAYTEISGGSNTTVSSNPIGTAKLGFDPRTQHFWMEDFGGIQTANTDPGNLTTNLSVTNGASAGNFAVGAATADHPGVVIYGLGVAGNNATQMIRTGTSMYSNNAGLVGECMITIAAASNAKVGCGFNDNTAGPDTATDGMLIYYDGSGANWVIRDRAAAGGNASASNTAVTFGTTAWHRLTIYVEAATGSGNGTVHFYVDGTELNNSPLTTDVPSGAQQFGYMAGYAQLAGGAVELARIDYMMVYGPISR